MEKEKEKTERGVKKKVASASMPSVHHVVIRVTVRIRSLTCIVHTNKPLDLLT